MNPHFIGPRRGLFSESSYLRPALDPLACTGFVSARHLAVRKTNEDVGSAPHQMGVIRTS